MARGLSSERLSGQLGGHQRDLSDPRPAPSIGPHWTVWALCWQGFCKPLGLCGQPLVEMSPVGSRSFQLTL